MSKYREYAIHPVDIKTFVSLRGFVDTIMAECATASIAANGTNDMYDEWVKVWKHNYNLLTDLVRETRVRHDLTQSQIHEVGNYLRRLANTMLNARQFAKDIRRNRG